MGMDAYGLGRLERLANPREIWKHEAVDFTPWLAENIDVLADAIGLPLTVVAYEVLVGDFRLDIHATDPDGRTVIIENQLEPSNHMHLGQLLVYASGLEASTAVWITTRLRDEHRSALTWINERTDSDVRVFGIELSVVQIGSSAKAPVLDVVVEPNNWSKAAKQASKASTVPEVNQARAAFFEEAFDVLASIYPVIKTPRPQASNWSSFASGPFGYYAFSFSKAGYRVDLYLDTGEQASTKEIFDQLEAEADSIHERLGFKLTWDRISEKRGSRLSTYLDGFALEDSDAQARTNAARWSAERARSLHSEFDGRLRAMVKTVKAVVGAGVATAVESA